MATYKGTLENASGDKLYPESSADIIKTSNNSDVQTELSAIPNTYLSQSDAASTYATKTELNNALTGMAQIFPYGTSKPASGQEGVIYFEETASNSSVYNKYIWENGAYINAGMTSIDLTNYVQKLSTSPAGSTGETTDKTLTYGGKFKVQNITVNADGQVTAIAEKEMTMPASDDTHYTATVAVAASNSGTSDATSDTTNSTTFLNIVENSAVSDSVQIEGSGTVSVTAKDGKITISGADTNVDTIGIPVVESNGSAPSNLASGALFFRKAASA